MILQPSADVERQRRPWSRRKTKIDENEETRVHERCRPYDRSAPARLLQWRVRRSQVCSTADVWCTQGEVACVWRARMARTSTVQYAARSENNKGAPGSETEKGGEVGERRAGTATRHQPTGAASLTTDRESSVSCTREIALAQAGESAVQILEGRMRQYEHVSQCLACVSHSHLHLHLLLQFAPLAATSGPQLRAPQNVRRGYCFSTAANPGPRSSGAREASCSSEWPVCMLRPRPLAPCLSSHPRRP